MKSLLKLYLKERELFRDEVRIAGLYGCIASCWGSGRVIHVSAQPEEVAEYMRSYPEISCELVFSNSLVNESLCHESNGNRLMKAFSENNVDVIINSPILEKYLRDSYGHEFGLISSITKVSSKSDTISELTEVRSDGNFRYKRVIVNGNFTKDFDFLSNIPNPRRCEILVNDVCTVVCPLRKEHFLIYDKAALGEPIVTNLCNADNGDIVASPLYKMMSFSQFVKIEELNRYTSRDICHFKIQGRTDYDSNYIETLVYYLIKLKHQAEVRQRLMLSTIYNYPI